MVNPKNKITIKKYALDFLILSICYIITTALFLVVTQKTDIKAANFYLYIFYLLIFFTGYTIQGGYRSIWRFYGLKDTVKNLIATVLIGTIYSLVCMGVGYIINENALVWLLFGLVLTIVTDFGILGVRFVCRYSYQIKKLEEQKSNNRKRLAIVGGGSMCHALLTSLDSITDCNYLPICIFDDDEAKIGARIEGVGIVASTEKIPEICKSMQIDEIILAIPTADSEHFRKITDLCFSTGCKVKTTPYISELNGKTGHEYWKQVREIKIEDLLERPVVLLDDTSVKKYIRDKVVLVTGGGGSIGSELCRQVASFSPAKLIILDVYENTTYEIQQELIRKYPGLPVFVEIASIRDREDIEKVFSEYRPQLVLHAAAHKHVPLMENNPEEAIKNNIFGTYNVIKTADKYEVEHFLLISTDKAVNPTNVMGATKRFCEIMIQSMKGQSKTVFAAVRFGNVLGSNGSVIPLFQRQIAEGGPVTVTHKDINRFFMTIPEAVRLVLLAGTTAESGNIFVLDMGQPVNIYEFAKKMIRMSGHVPDEDIKIKITGLRPGEKLYEELLVDENKVDKTKIDRVFIEKMPVVNHNKIEEDLTVLRDALETDNREEVFMALKKVVPTYRPDVENHKNLKCYVDRGSGKASKDAV